MALCLGFKISMEIRTLSAAEKIRGIIKFLFASNSVAEAAFQNRVACDTANKSDGATDVVVSDWTEAYNCTSRPLLLCNLMLYLSEIRERVEDDLQLQPHEVPSLSAICLCIQRLNFTSKKIVKTLWNGIQQKT